MSRAATITVVLLSLTWLHGRVGGGYAWDALNALGFAAMAAFAALHLDGLRSTPGPVSRLRERLSAHAHLAYVALALVALHALGLLVYDPTLLVYVEPGAPTYMIVGVVAAVLAVAVIFSAQLPRRLHWHGSATRFRRVHRWLAGVLVGLVAWHVVGSAFYLDHWLTQSAAVLLCVACVLWPRPVARGLDRILAALPMSSPRAEAAPASAASGRMPWRVGGAWLLLLALATVARNV